MKHCMLLALAESSLILIVEELPQKEDVKQVGLMPMK
jgi:hypothetical protein